MKLRPPSRKSSLKAFTLLELLAVIAIVAVLAALLFLGLQGMIKRGQGAKSLSNLKQIGQITLSWAAERNMRFPLTSDSRANYWFRALEKDVLEWDRGKQGNTVPPVFRCPLLNRTPMSQRQPTPDYASNTWVLTQANGPRPSDNHPWSPFSDQQGRALSTLLVRQPSKTIMFTTGSYWLISPAFPTGGGTETTPNPVLQNGKAFGAVFCDGHVEVIPGAKVYEDSDKLENRRALFDPFHEP